MRVIDAFLANQASLASGYAESRWSHHFPRPRRSKPVRCGGVPGLDCGRNAGGRCGTRCLSSKRGEPLRAGSGPVLPLRPAPVSASAEAPRADTGNRRGFDSVPWIRATASAPALRRRLTHFSRTRRPRASATGSPPPWRPPIIGSRSKPWPTRSVAASELCAATSGCSAWDIPRTSHCASALN